MKPIFHDYEYFESAFYDISQGIKEMVKQKLSHLRDRKWIFKGSITYPNYKNIEFALQYHDKDTEERYSITGICNIQEQIILNEAIFDFEVLNECKQKFVSFKMDIDSRDELLEIEETINLLLENNRSYKYFCEDYGRYTRQNLFGYIKELLSSHLLEFDEEVCDEECGCTYHYSGEFGEDLFEIVVDNNDCAEEDIFDFIKINVSDRFYFCYSEPYSKEIRSLWPFLKQAVIPINDFLIRTNTRFCINKEHRLHRIKALVCIDNGYSINEVSAEAMYCEGCNHYFISELEYEKLCRLGRICSRVITIEEYRRVLESGYHSWAKKSLLRSYGYNVNAQENLSDRERQRILSFVIENEIMKSEEIISFIEWLIRRNVSRDYFNARIKWGKDIQYIRGYKPIEGIVRVRDIYRKRYINK